MNIDKAITYAESIVRKSLNYFYDCFPTEQSENLVFKKFENVSWTTGFYEGILWLMYELTGDKAFYNSAKHHSEMFHKRWLTELNWSIMIWASCLHYQVLLIIR